MLLVDGLATDAERGRDLAPRPAVGDRALDLARLEAVGEPAQRDDRRQALGGILRNRFLVGWDECHGVNGS
ncbi:MAG: hypothetical protein QOG94_404 [Solirubrobacteraceae bacterium]|nr:hypothetical protein [Solirubrobacteraceae bacterium]